MPLTSGKEAKILDNFGEKICKMLDHKLEKHVEENGKSGCPQFFLLKTQRKKKKNCFVLGGKTCFKGMSSNP